MKKIGKIIHLDMKRLGQSVVAVVVIMGLCLVPSLYAWFNILSNWDPYGPASTSNIKVAVANEDDGAELGARVMTLAENYPPDVLNACMTILSTHDTPRALTALMRSWMRPKGRASATITSTASG